MSVRFLGSIAARRLSARRLLRHTRNLSDGPSGRSSFFDRLPMGKDRLYDGVAVVATFYAFTAMSYLKDNTVEQSCQLTEEEAMMSTKDDAAIEARFEEWMKNYRRTYKDNEEKAHRFKLFKACVEDSDLRNAARAGGCRFALGHFADMTPEETKSCFNFGGDTPEEMLRELPGVDKIFPGTSKV